MIIPIKLSGGATLPANAHPSDTGYDLVTISDPVIVGKSAGTFWRRVDYIEYDTGVSVAPPRDIVGQPVTYSTAYLEVFPRSSISKTNLVLANSIGLIDNAYRGTIKLRFRYLWQPADLRLFEGESFAQRFAIAVDTDRIYERGDKIGQLVARTKQEIEWQTVDELPRTARSDGGFGSTDRIVGRFTNAPAAPAYTLEPFEADIGPDLNARRSAPRPQGTKRTDTPFNPLDHEQTK